MHLGHRGSWHTFIVQHSPDSLIRTFLDALVARDLDTACTMVSGDFEYDNVPIGKAFGPEGLRTTLTGFFGMCTAIDWQTLRQVSSGDLARGTVLNERDDRVEIHGVMRSLPVAGVFEIRDGLITLWRDYFDRETLMSLMSPPQT